MSFEKRTICPHCDANLDLASGIVEKGAPAPTPPDDGDISLCIRCGEWGVFASDLPGGLRKPNINEYIEILKQPNVIAMQAAWRMANEAMKGKK